MLTKWRLNPADAVYVGDNPVKDFQAPQQLGMKSLWFKNEDGLYSDAAGISKPTISSLDELSSII